MSRKNCSFTDEEAAYLRKIIPGNCTTCVAKQMSLKTGKNITARKIQIWKKNNHVKSGYNSRFIKGEPSWIKGKKFPGKTNSGCFKKGHLPANRIEIGKESIHSGYPVVKIQDGKLNSNFEFKARLVWKEAYGDVPKGKRILHLDGDRMNCDLSNLILVDDSEMLVANRHFGLSQDPEINKVIFNTSRLMIKASKGGRKK